MARKPKETEVKTDKEQPAVKADKDVKATENYDQYWSKR